jgi:hypothetical protein
VFRAPEANLRPAEPASRRRLLAWGALMAFLMAQVGDGLLTYAGITQFGWQIEANPIVKWYVLAFGPETGLAGAKTFAFACVLPLHCRGMYRTIGALTLVYVAGAVILWLHVLWG